jgi:hypothetical protein
MMAPRKGFRLRLGGRKSARSRLDEVTERTREESRALARERRVEARRRRIEARQRIRDEGARLEELGVRLRGALFETRRRLRPITAPFGALLDRVAPYLTRTLLFCVQLVAAFIALVLAIGQTALRWLAGKANDGAIAASIALERTVTPLRTVAFVGAAAAVALGVSQFFDYHGVAVDAPDYAGEIGSVAPVPITATKSAGSAHLWILLPLAAVALVLVAAAYRSRRPRMAGAVSLCGVIGVAVALAIDLPQGLEVGRAGLAFTGTDAVLLQGFWAEIASSAVLILCGGLLAVYSRGVSPDERRWRGTGESVRPRRRASHQDVGGMSPGLQAES